MVNLAPHHRSSKIRSSGGYRGLYSLGLLLSPLHLPSQSYVKRNRQIQPGRTPAATQPPRERDAAGRRPRPTRFPQVPQQPAEGWGSPRSSHLARPGSSRCQPRLWHPTPCRAAATSHPGPRPARPRRRRAPLTPAEGPFPPLPGLHGTLPPAGRIRLM